MTHHTHPWPRLTAGARLAPADTRDTAAPHGFATRVAALAFSRSEAEMQTVLARFAWRAFGVAAVLMVVSVFTNFTPALSAFESNYIATLSDPVTEWLDLS